MFSLTKRSFAAPSVLVKVGVPSTEFHVDQNLICESSDFFSTAMKPEWRANEKDAVVELPDDDPDSFNAYMNWLHSRRVTLGLRDWECLKTRSDFFEFIRAYALADKVRDVDFKDAVTDAMIVSMNTTVFNSRDVMIPSRLRRCQIYENTAEGSSARRLVAHRFARCKCDNLDLDLDPGEEDCKAFLVDLAVAALRKDDESTVEAAARCAFHDHVPGVEHCYRTKYA